MDRGEEKQHERDPEADAQSIKQCEEPFALLKLFILFSLEDLGGSVEGSVGMGNCACKVQFCAPIDEIEKRAAVGGALGAQVLFFKHEMRQTKMQKVKRCDKTCAESAQWQERERGEECEQTCEQGRRYGAQVEVAQCFAACQKIMQKFTLTHGSLSERQFFHGLTVGCELQLFVAGECEAMGEQAVEVTKDGARYAAGTHAGDAECQRGKRRRERGAGDDPCSGADEREAGKHGEKSGEERGKSFRGGSQAHKT